MKSEFTYSRKAKSELERLDMKHTCKQCGKRFSMSIDISKWGYTSRFGRTTIDQSKKLFCSYKCLREYEKPFIEKHKRELKTIYET